MKRTRRETLRAILSVLKDGRPHSYSDLESKVNTNWNTVRDHCSDLELFGAATISNEGVTITQFGLQVWKKLS